ncbi:hypothetical protein BDV29DRAFT_162059 [Aspergillus leporis]|uniref:Uncharacterized protein n=1 Tax=Aspergillus leporis TaxID=41062 RepID=A0A5N5WJV2_9EURO|nr:hypothetical protein BDV29DRAFT_162059 [Aspergillus leporis]
MLWRSWAMLGLQEWGLTGPPNGTVNITRDVLDSLFGHYEAITGIPGAIFAPEFHRPVSLNQSDSEPRDHSTTIKGLVASGRLLEWTVEDGWEPLCQFLEKDLPTDELPFGNTVDKTLDAFSSSIDPCAAAAVRNLIIFVVCACVAGAYGLSSIS